MSQPLLGRCKDCDFALFVAPEQTETLREVSELRDIKQSGVPYRVGRTILARCDQRHRVFSLRPVEGTYSPDHKCDSRCLNAKGWKCKCSCGGANHGRGHAVVHVASEHVETASVRPGPVESTVPKGERFLGEVGRHITGEVKLVHKRHGNPTVYTFMTLDGTAKLTWFCPGYADPKLNEGEVFRIRAKVKRHDNLPAFGPTTIVTYVEGPAGQPLEPKGTIDD